jgi:arylsulfatase A-like enzyme
MKTCPAAFLLVFALLPLVSCSNERQPVVEEIGIPFLLERLDGARLYRAGKPLPLPRSTDRARDLRISVTLSSPAGWQPMPVERARGLGLEDEALTGWYLDVVLPTDDADGVVLASPHRELGRWQRPNHPEPFAAFYQPGGFIREGVYLALPRKMHPRDLELRANFHPTPPARAEHLAASHEPFRATELATHVTAAAVTRPALFLTPGVAVAFPVTLPAAAVLRFGLASKPGLSPSPVARAGNLRVGFREGPTGSWQIEERLPFELGVGSEWHDVRLDLASAGGHVGELVFELLDAEASDRLHFVGDPMLEVPRSNLDPNLLLIVVDGLRADRLDRRDLMPRLTGLAAAGLRFESARAAAPWTRPSISSLFTGTPPSRHGVQREMNSDVLPTDLPTLAEALRRAGYATASFSANLHLHPAFGLDRGFGYRHSALADARRINELALEWIDARPTGPFFSFLFFMDTHYPFTHRPEYDRSSTLDAALPPWGTMTSRLGRARAGAPDPAPVQLQLLEALYDENVRYIDELIGELLDELARRGLRENTLVVVTADHGEAFGEHGDLFHGWNLYDELLRVPLVVAHGPLDAAGNLETPVSLTDLAASLLSLLRVPAQGLPGRTDLLANEVDPIPAHAIHAETRFRRSDAATILADEYKLIWHQETGRLELYDLREDPGETQSLHSLQAARAVRLKNRLENFLAFHTREREESVVATPAARLSPEEVEQLRTLGYLP